MAFEIHRRALADGIAAYRYYARISPQLAARFMLELDDTIDRVDRMPQAWPKHIRGTRFYRFPSYPYRLIYIERATDILILAITHHARNPLYWQRRLKN